MPVDARYRCRPRNANRLSPLPRRPIRRSWHASRIKKTQLGGYLHWACAMRREVPQALHSDYFLSRHRMVSQTGRPRHDRRGLRRSSGLVQVAAAVVGEDNLSSRRPRCPDKTPLDSLDCPCLVPFTPFQKCGELPTLNRSIGLASRLNLRPVERREDAASAIPGSATRRPLR